MPHPYPALHLSSASSLTRAVPAHAGTYAEALAPPRMRPSLTLCITHTRTRIHALSFSPCVTPAAASACRCVCGTCLAATAASSCRGWAATPTTSGAACSHRMGASWRQRPRTARCVGRGEVVALMGTEQIDGCYSRVVLCCCKISGAATPCARALPGVPVHHQSITYVAKETMQC